MENDLKQEMKDNLKKPEDDLKQNGRRSQKNGRRPQVQFKKSILIGCDVIVNYPLFLHYILLYEHDINKHKRINI